MNAGVGAGDGDGDGIGDGVGGGGDSNRIARVYPSDASTQPGLDIIEPAEAVTLHGLLRARAARSPQRVAYIQFEPSAGRPDGDGDGDGDGDDAGDGDGAGRWTETTWSQFAAQVERWRRAVAAERFARGARAAVCMRNRREWAVFDQACLAAGLVVVPLYAEDRADNIAYILADTEAQLLLVENFGVWRQLESAVAAVDSLTRVVVVDGDGENKTENKNIETETKTETESDSRLLSLQQWLASGARVDSAADAASNDATQPDDLATIVYTSGTTGKPKGVMLSHANILSNARAGLRSVAVFPADKFLSFLPLSHMFERTVGYYLPLMAGATVAFNRAVAELPADLAIQKPTIMISVPRIFERAHAAIAERLARGPAPARWLFNLAVDVGWRRFERAQGRAGWHPKLLLWHALDALVARKVRRRFGGDLKCVISGGAPLAAHIARVFIALGVDILQGYGLTETSPTLSVNTRARNKPASIGLPFIGTEIRLSKSGELQSRGPGIMRGYWRNEAATRACIDAQGWFSSGDLARIDADGFLFITGRSKDIIVTATGEKVPPADMEVAICEDALFEQAMVVGEGRAFLSAVVVLNAQQWRDCAAKLGVDADDDAALATATAETFMRERIAARLRDFPGYAAVHRVCATLAPWTTEDGTLTPTLKIKRAVLRERFAAQLDAFYRD